MSQTELPHTKLEIGSVSPAVLVCGDPARATRMAAFLENAILLAEWREYRSFRGTYRDRPVTICSHGIGAPGAAVAFEELIRAGARTIIRVGSCGGIRPEVQAGHVVNATAAVDHTGYGREVVPPGYPAVATAAIAEALRAMALAHPRPCHSGVVMSRDAFYGGVSMASVPDYQVMAAAQVLAVEMECAALFVVGSLRQVQTGAVLAVDGNVLAVKESMDTFNPHTEAVQQATDQAIQMALDALVSGYDVNR